MAQPGILAVAARPLKALFVSDAFEGVLLIAVAVLAIIVANSPWGAEYQHLFHGTLPWTPIPKLSNLHLWINDALMAVFFFVVGLEVKKEMIAGNLADAQARRLPVLSAVAGMAAPALIYLFVASGEPNLERGWAIPAAAPCSVVAVRDSGIVGRFVDELFPAATVAVVAGSAALGTRTPTSDVDLLLVGPAEMFREGHDSLAAAYAFEGEVFEVFAYTAASFDRWSAADVAGYRPVLAEMLLEGLPVRHGPLLDELRARWRPVVERGSDSGPHELALLRYQVTDLLDDLRDACDPLERRVVAAELLERTASLMLLSNGRWLASGKQLPRRLRAWDAARADRLAVPFLADDFSAFADAVQAELDVAGGRVHAGFVR